MTIEINNIIKKYNNVLAVKNINFKIDKGSIVGLLGPNGCGKTTTIGMMLGLIKPTSGNVIINGQNIENEKNRTNILEKVNFISPYVELPKKLTVEENLKVYGKMYGVTNLKEKISELMNQLNLLEFKKRKTGELSSGQKNRVALAKSLINKPKLLFLDEPTAGLDPITSKQICKFISDSVSKLGATTISISSDLKTVDEISDQIVMINDGQVVWNGSASQLYKTENAFVQQFVDKRATGPIKVAV